MISGLMLIQLRAVRVSTVLPLHPSLWIPNGLIIRLALPCPTPSWMPSRSLCSAQVSSLRRSRQSSLSHSIPRKSAAFFLSIFVGISLAHNDSLEAWADLPVVFMSKTYALTALALVAAPREIHRQHMKRMDEENRLGPSGDVAQAPLRACQCQERGATPRSIAASHSLEDQCGAPDVKFGQAHLAIAGVARSAEGSPATRGTIVASTLIPSPRSAQIAPPPLRSVPYEIEIGPYRYAKRAAAAYSKQRQCRTAESYPPARARWGRWAEDGDERAVKDTGRLSFREFMGLDEYDYDHCHEMEKQEIVEMEDTFPSLPAAGLQTRQPWYIGRLPSSTDEAEPGTVATSRLRIRDSLPLVSGADHRKVSYTVLW